MRLENFKDVVRALEDIELRFAKKNETTPRSIQHFHDFKVGLRDKVESNEIMTAKQEDGTYNLGIMIDGKLFRVDLTEQTT